MSFDTSAYRWFSIRVVGCALLIVFGATIVSCAGDEREIEIILAAQVPDEADGQSLRWSPKGEKLFLLAEEGGLSTNLRLGPDGTAPLPIRLEKSEGQIYYDRLLLDRDRNGAYSDDEIVETVPKEIRARIWSSFETVVNVPVTDPASGESQFNPYALSFWFVDDPTLEEEELVIRYSRRGWMEGTAKIDGIDAVVLLTESTMDGVFDERDYWALAVADSAATIFELDNARPAERHAWLGENAYSLIDIDPSGRRIVLVPFGAEVTRAEEAEIDDHLAEDRRAARSGRTVAFLSDYAEAKELAKANQKLLFLDFETEWCGPCHVMDEWVYTADVVVDASADFVAVKIDGDESPDLKELFEVEGYPTILIVNPDGEVLERRAGYMSVAEMTAFLTGS